MVLVSDLEWHYKKLLWLTHEEHRLVNLIRADKGLAPVLVHSKV